MKYYVISFAIGLLIGAGALFAYYHYNPNIQEKIKVVQIEGKEIKHKNIKTRGKNIEFITESKGKGKIKTIIPKSLIPEARAWNKYTNTIQYQFYAEYSRTPTIGHSLSYWKRFSRFQLGVGVKINQKMYTGGFDGVGGFIGAGFIF